MSLFVNLEIDRESCLGLKECGKCLKVCPVGIFGEDGEYPQAIEANQDECTLCELCLEACRPGAIKVRKLYED
jgi:ferredoxin